jgi:hypothetical protein
MRKFKVGDWLVRNANFTRNFPEGWESRVLEDFCVADLDGQLIPINYHYWKLAEDTSKPVTQEYQGNVYDLEGIYLANDIGSGEGNLWTTIRLNSINPKSTHPFRVSDREGWKYITVIRSPQTFGTITPAPIDLIDGNAYTFDYHKNRKPAIGVYSKSNETFLTVSDDHFAFNCTNIRPMTVAESK